MTRLLENRVTKLEDRRRGAGRFDDWTEEQLLARLADLDAIFEKYGPFEELIASLADMPEAEKAKAIELHRKYSPEYSRQV